MPALRRFWRNPRAPQQRQSRFRLDLSRPLGVCISEPLNMPHDKPKSAIWLSSEEARKRLQVSSCELMHLREAGDLNFEKHGNAFLYSSKDVEQRCQPDSPKSRDRSKEPSVVRQAEWVLLSFARPRLTFSRISQAEAVQTNGLGSALWTAR